MSSIAFVIRQLLQTIRVCVLAGVLGSLVPGVVRAGVEEDAQKAALLLALPIEDAGFDFRADVWSKEISPEMGKAARIQMFKGNDYRVCVSVPPRSGVEITAHVLNADGKPVETKAERTKDGSGTVLHVKPSKTGVYLFVVRISGGKNQKTWCAMITGYK